MIKLFTVPNLYPVSLQCFNIHENDVEEERNPFVKVSETPQQCEAQ